MPEPLIMACLSDVAGQVRGKGFALRDLERRCQSGVGWTPTNVQITCFDGIAPSPYGAEGDLILFPDIEALFQTQIVPDAPALQMVLGEVRDRDGEPWTACLRSQLRTAIGRIEAACGLEVRVSFEHEFTLSNVKGGTGFSLAGFHEVQAFSERLWTALGDTGLAPDSLLREYGPGQFEVTIAPKPALRAADEAIALREITRATARACGYRASFAPMVSGEGVGNGVHVHLSFWDKQGRPQTHDPNGRAELGNVAGAAAAGIVANMPSIVALTAPSGISYLRLQPHRWSAAFANLAVQDREAGLRVCPQNSRDPETIARQYNYEYRAADAAASPWLCLSALLHAAAEGIEANMPCPSPTQGDLSLLSKAALQVAGVTPLPRSPEAALSTLLEDATVRDWYPDGFLSLYVDHKTYEFSECAGLALEDKLRRYGNAY